MTQLPTTPTDDSPPLSANEKTTAEGSTSAPGTSQNPTVAQAAAATSSESTSAPKKHHIRSPNAPRHQRRNTGAPWCKAMLYTILIVIGLYFWLSWTDPDQIAMRQRAWDAAMERIRGKQVTFANRYSKEYKYRPAASPIITETLSDGRTRLRGARHGDNIPIPTATPTSTKDVKKNKKRDRKRKTKKN